MPKLHHRQSHRLPHYDYSQAGAYFVTVCAYNRVAILGEVIDESVKLSPIGEIVQNAWEEIPAHFETVELDEFVVMPNHMHGIIWIREDSSNRVGAQHAAPLQKTDRPNVKPGSLGAIMRSFKAAATKRINALGPDACQRVWQRGYYDHVLRDDEDLHNHRKYILDNPPKWTLDEYYLKAVPDG
ncbi:MAG: transposase [Chloroflexi bacterium]|nr:MAG: transposase [Chloroflexota bacterium]MBL1193294.1 transposase [Chloroflexota bacterium]NOH10586.1 transposase [Chloroflexota bacterium]